MSFLLVFAVSFILAVLYIWYQQKSDAQYLDRCAEMKNFEKDMDIEELAQYNGKGKNQGVIFIGVNGVIFDVSDSDFYRPGSAYGIFAGTDASVSLSKHSLTGEWNNKTQEVTLSEGEVQGLKEWYERFSTKYRKVGKILY